MGPLQDRMSPPQDIRGLGPPRGANGPLRDRKDPSESPVNAHLQADKRKKGVGEYDLQEFSPTPCSLRNTAPEPSN